MLNSLSGVNFKTVLGFHLFHQRWRRYALQRSLLHYYILLVILVMPSFVTSQGPDNRCYLENGGSAESFFVNEAQSVGAIVGSLRIVGDPGPRGNIVLSLKEKAAPVRIQAGSKNLTLTRKLDKEGLDGPASVFVNVVCDRKGTADPTFLIPVSIRVTDANDNAPVFLGGPYHLNLSEVTLIGSRILHGIRAVDADQQGPYSTVQYSVVHGPYSEFVTFPNGLEGTLVLMRPLDYESLTAFNVELQAEDQGIPPQSSRTSLSIQILDADDQNPIFRRPRYEASTPEPPLQGSQLQIEPEALSAFDQDLGINSPITYSLNGDSRDYRFFAIDGTTGQIYLRQNLDLDDLPQPVTLVLRATQIDNPDRYALATLRVRRVGALGGAPDLHFVEREFQASHLESVPVGSSLLTLLTSRPGDPRVRYTLDDTAGTFGTSERGEVVLLKTFDYEIKESFRFNAYVTDGRMNDSARVLISVLNVNDWEPRFRHPQYEFKILPGKGKAGEVIGKVEAHDGDKGDQVSFTLRGAYAKSVGITARGELFLVGSHPPNITTLHLVAVAKDSGVPPHQASVPVILHLPPELTTLAQRTAEATDASFLLLVVFGVLLGILAVVTVSLALYVCKQRKGNGHTNLRPLSTRNPLASKFAGALNGTSGLKMALKDTKRVSPYIEPANLTPSTQVLPTATVRGLSSLHPPRSAQLRNGLSTLPLPQHNHHEQPSLPCSPTPQQQSMNNNEDDNEGHDTCNSRTSWSRGSIPRKVKKLSWEDEQKKSEMDLGVNNLPSATTEDDDPERPRLTIYF